VSDFVIGLTGGIGSGKSTVADTFVALGASLVDTDAIAHELTGPQGAAMPALQAAFGDSILSADGAMNRAAMRQLVFSDPQAKSRLESLLHPRIRQLAAERCQAATTPYVILAVPLLLESGNYRQRCQRIAVVDCPESVQISRVMQRSSLPADEVRRIM
jgi:dephospho-CoA kinase